MKRKFTAVILTLLICLAVLPVFSGCKAETNFTLKSGEDGDYYSFSLSGYTGSFKGEYEIPSEHDGLPVKEIEDEGLSNSGITKLVIPETVEKIGVAAFSYNYNLREVVFKDGSNLKKLPRGTFGYCRTLRSITLPESVESVGALAFYACESLSEVALPEGLKLIGERAFEGCFALKGIALPQNLERIGALAFYNSALEEVTIPDSVKDVEVTEEGEDKKPVTKIQNGLGYGAFHSCTKLKKAVVGSGITVLASGVFGYCTALEEVYLPSGLKSIEGAYYIDGAFECGHAFHNNKNLKDVYFAGSKQQWEAVKINNDKVNVQGADYDNSALTKATVHYGS